MSKRKHSLVDSGYAYSQVISATNAGRLGSSVPNSSWDNHPATTPTSDHVFRDPSRPYHSLNGQASVPVISLTAKPCPTGEAHPALCQVTALSLPTITRKITACSACRKQKIRCEMPNEEPPCLRCERRGLSCVLNKSLQSILDDGRRTELLQVDVSQLHRTLLEVCRHLHLEAPQTLRSSSQATEVVGGGGAQSDLENDDNACEISPPDSPSDVHAPIDTFLEVAKVTSPDSAETPQSARSRKLPTRMDLVTKGIITLETAEALVREYFSRLDHYLYGICNLYKDIHSVRDASPVLFAAICTVSALHDPQNQSTYEKCNKEFRRLVSRAVFEKHDLNFIRALCVASFWLSDASRIFSSDAIRRAADMRLHMSLYRSLESRKAFSSLCCSSKLTKEQAEDRVRLWYLLFICDQHLSVLHNRDPLFRSDKDIAINWEAFLERDSSTDSDVRIVSQVSLLLIMCQIRDTLSADLRTRLPASANMQIGMLSRQLDQWFAKFLELFKPNPQLGDFPRLGLQLHYQFARLYLGHHALKGLEEDTIPSQLISAASMAHDAALTIFNMMLDDSQLKASLVGMPHYFHIMITFAGCLLLQLSDKYREQLRIDQDKDLDLLQEVLHLFRSIACMPSHPLCRMANGLGRRLFDERLKRKISIPIETIGPMYDHSFPQISSETNGVTSTSSAKIFLHPLAAQNGEAFLYGSAGYDDLSFFDFDKVNFSNLA